MINEETSLGTGLTAGDSVNHHYKGGPPTHSPPPALPLTGRGPHRLFSLPRAASSAERIPCTKAVGVSPSLDGGT